jgi:hypothetical protein
MNNERGTKARRFTRRFLLLVGAALIVMLAYGTILAFPEPLFAHKYSYKNFCIYSRSPLDDRIRVELEVVSQRLAASELNDPKITHRVFVTGSPSWYAFFNGPYRGAMARNYEFNNSIFVPQLDLSRGLVVHFDGRTAPIPEILAHEMTHTLERKRLGIINLWRAPFWKNEGYAEYIGNPRTVPITDDLQVLDGLRSNVVPIENGFSVPRQYFEAAILWRYLIEIRGLSFAAIMSDSIRNEQVEEEMRTWAKQRKAT